MNTIKKIRINPKDINQISPKLILKIILKDETVIILDESIPCQSISRFLKTNYNKPINYRNNNLSINLNINNSSTKEDYINGKEFETNDSYLFNRKIYHRDSTTNKTINTNNYFYSPNIKYTINNQIENTKNNEKIDSIHKSQNQDISEIVTAKLQRKYNTQNSSANKSKQLKTSINSEIKLNIKGDDSKKKFQNNLLKDFNELLINFNNKKNGLANNFNRDNSQKKYKYYKQMNDKRIDKLFLSKIACISPNTKSIKYIQDNEPTTNATIITELNGNKLEANWSRGRLTTFLKDKSLKRNKSNNFYIFKNQKNKSDIVSPPNYLLYKKIFTIQK